MVDIQASQACKSADGFAVSSLRGKPARAIRHEERSDEGETDWDQRDRLDESVLRSGGGQMEVGTVIDKEAYRLRLVLIQSGKLPPMTYREREMTIA